MKAIPVHNTRPQYNDSYRQRRVLRVHFYTSNTDKLLQARLVFSRFGQTVRFYRGHQEPYEENYGAGTEQLLKNAVNYILKNIKLNSIFFIEDTSLRIEALSDANDFPGMQVKEWFSQTSFEELNTALQARGNDRRVTVKSDVALHMPTLSQPILLHGETAGVVAENAPTFSPNVQYPWLTPHTFNGWFIPTGSEKRLGEMEFEESMQYDFRAKAFIQLATRINELNASLNTPQQHYVQRYSNREVSGEDQNGLQPRGQLRLRLLAADIENLIVIGPKCAGKTTLGDYLQNKEGYSHIEASTVLRELGGKIGADVSNNKAALKFLKSVGLDLVTKELSEYYLKYPNEKRINVITGLRTIEEIIYFLKSSPSTIILYIDCDSRIRFERHLRRSRSPSIKTYAEFRKNDEEEQEFGLLRVGDLVSDIAIKNDGEMREFHIKIDEFVAHMDASRREKNLVNSEIVRSLRALKEIGRKATCEEISEMSGNFSPIKVRKYNTNRALKEVPEFARRHEARSAGLLRYSLLPRGRKFLELVGMLQED